MKEKFYLFTIGKRLYVTPALCQFDAEVAFDDEIAGSHPRIDYRVKEVEYEGIQDNWTWF